MRGNEYQILNITVNGARGDSLQVFDRGSVRCADESSWAGSENEGNDLNADSRWSVEAPGQGRGGRLCLGPGSRSGEGRTPAEPRRKWEGL